MASTTDTLEQHTLRLSRPKLIIASLVASMVMGMWQMIVEAFVGGGFWSPVVYIAATVVRSLQSLRPPVGFDAIPVVLGLMGHMMNSVILGAIFYRIARGRGWRAQPALIGGMVWGVVVFAAMWYVVVPLVDPVMLQVNAAAFFLGHLMWGAVLGLAVTWARRG